MYNNMYSTREPKLGKEKRPGGGRRILSICLVVVLCAAAGFGGGWLASSLSHGEENHASVTIQQVDASQISQQNTSLDDLTVVEQVVSQRADSVVQVNTESKQTNALLGSFILSGAGSGVVLSDNGYIVTNHHVVEDANTISVQLHNGEEYPATVVGADAQTDLAVIKIDVTGLSPVTFGDSSQIVVGQLAIVIGNPLGTLGGSVSQGIISARDREIVIEGESMTLLQTTAAINPGNSGGALFDENGLLVGVVNSKTSGTGIEGIGFAIPVNTVSQIVPELIENGHIAGRSSLDVQLVDINSLEQLAYRVDTPGVYVASVSGGNGLESGDRITVVAGQAVSSSSDVTKLVHQHQAGDTITITVVRNGSEKEIAITLSEVND